MMEARKMFSPNGCGSKPLLSSRANADEYVVDKILQRRKQEGCETSPSADVRAMRVVYSIFSRVFFSLNNQLADQSLTGRCISRFLGKCRRHLLANAAMTSSNNSLLQSPLDAPFRPCLREKSNVFFYDISFSQLIRWLLFL